MEIKIKQKQQYATVLKITLDVHVIKSSENLIGFSLIL